MNPLISPAEVDHIIATHLPEQTCEAVPLLEALGRPLQENVLADRPFPPFRRAMMDGICCHRADAGKPLPVHGLHAAGAPAPTGLPEGTCYEIMTGAVVPEDCDLLVPYEEVEIIDGVAQVTAKLPPEGAFIHEPGSDAATGDIILKSGTILTPPCLGIAASAGREQLLVTRPPSIGVLSTGDELVEIHEAPAAWQIRRSNPVALAACLKKAGISDLISRTADDSFEGTVTEIKSLIEDADLVLISGGISKGKRDYIRPALESLCGPPLFHGVAQRPGKPLGLWKTDGGKLIFALPGNPTSAMTCCLRYIVPAISPAAATSVILTEPVSPHPSLTCYLPARLEGHLATPAPARNSGDEVSTTLPEGFLHLPPGSEPLQAGRTFPFTSYL